MYSIPSALSCVHRWHGVGSRDICSNNDSQLSHLALEYCYFVEDVLVTSLLARCTMNLFTRCTVNWTLARLQWWCAIQYSFLTKEINNNWMRVIWWEFQIKWTRIFTRNNSSAELVIYLSIIGMFNEVKPISWYKFLTRPSRLILKGTPSYDTLWRLHKCILSAGSLTIPSLGTLRNRTAGRLRTAEWRKNVTQDRECTVLRDIFASFCRPESSSRPVA